MAQSTNDFLEEQRRAIERMQEMYRKQQVDSASHPMPPTPGFVRLNYESHSQDGDVKNAAADSAKSNETNPADERTYSRQEHKGAGGFGQHTNFLSNILGGLNSPSAAGLKLDKDITLVLGIILILASEKADRKLLLALLYILM